MESLWASLKNEMYYRTSFATREEAKLACIDWIERNYNRSRPYLTVGYRHPADLMEEFMDRMRGVSGKTHFLAA